MRPPPTALRRRPQVTGAWTDFSPYIDFIFM